MSIKSEAKKDAKRYAKAKMNYGTGAGIDRRHIKAELDKKMQNQTYKQAFDAEMDKIDYEKIVRDIKVKNKAKNSALNVKRGVKNLAKAGTLAATGFTVYSAHKEEIDGIVNNVKIAVKNRINRIKYKKHTKIVNMSDAKKAEAYLKSVGIDYTYE